MLSMQVGDTGHLKSFSSTINYPFMTRRKTHGVDGLKEFFQMIREMFSAMFLKNIQIVQQTSM